MARANRRESFAANIDQAYLTRPNSQKQGVGAQLKHQWTH